MIREFRVWICNDALVIPKYVFITFSVPNPRSHPLHGVNRDTEIPVIKIKQTEWWPGIVRTVTRKITIRMHPTGMTETTAFTCTLIWRSATRRAQRHCTWLYCTGGWMPCGCCWRLGRGRRNGLRAPPRRTSRSAWLQSGGTGPSVTREREKSTEARGQLLQWFWTRVREVVVEKQDRGVFLAGLLSAILVWLLFVWFIFQTMWYGFRHCIMPQRWEWPKNHFPLYECRALKLLLENHHDVTVKDDRGQTLLHLAASFGLNDAIETLLGAPGGMELLDSKERLHHRWAAALRVCAPLPREWAVTGDIFAVSRPVESRRFNIWDVELSLLWPDSCVLRRLLCSPETLSCSRSWRHYLYGNSQQRRHPISSPSGRPRSPHCCT